MKKIILYLSMIVTLPLCSSTPPKEYLAALAKLPILPEMEAKLIHDTGYMSFLCRSPHIKPPAASADPSNLILSSNDASGSAASIDTSPEGLSGLTAATFVQPISAVAANSVLSNSQSIGTTHTNALRRAYVVGKHLSPAGNSNN